MRWFETIRKIAAHVCDMQHHTAYCPGHGQLQSVYGFYRAFLMGHLRAVRMFHVLRYGDRTRCGQA